MKAFESISKRSSGSTAKWSPEAQNIRPPISLSTRERSDDPRWSLVQRILASHSLRRSTLLANFLRFVCDRYLEGKTSEINERQIGFYVFGRMEGYNASDDNIVRNYARTLRKRLAEYFATEGKHEDLILLIPRGGYVPVFLSRDAKAATAEQPASSSTYTEASSELISIALPDSVERGTTSLVIPDQGVHSAAPLNTSQIETAESQKSEERLAAESGLTETKHEKEDKSSKWAIPWSRKHFYALAALCCLLCSALAGYIAGMHGSPGRWFHQETETAKVNRIFWSGLFDEKRDTFIVPSDGGLVMLQSFVKEHVSLEEYANGSYRKESQIAQGIAGLIKDTDAEDTARLVDKVEALGNRRYTSLADLGLTTYLARLPEVVPERLMIRYARDLRMDDLRTSNVILIGSIEANPWVDLFQRQLNFQFTHGANFGGSGIITNKHLLPGEHQTYFSEPNDPLLRTYGVIAYVPNLNGTGHVLLIEGVNMAGTQAAGEFLLNPTQMQPVLEHALGPKGGFRSFEVLIETDNIAANASRPHILGERIGLP